MAIDWGNLSVNYEEYVKQFDIIINKEPQRLMRLVFDVFDFNKDGFIDEIDITAILKLVEVLHVKYQKVDTKSKHVAV